MLRSGQIYVNWGLSIPLPEDFSEAKVHTGAMDKDCGTGQSLKVPETADDKTGVGADNARCPTTSLEVSFWVSCHGAGMLGVLLLAGDLRRGFHEF